MDPFTMQILVGVAKGLVFGAITVGIGYIKNETWETFDVEKFLKTMVIGAILGGVAGTGHSLTEASVILGREFNVDPLWVEGSLMVSIIALADNVTKVVSRRTPLHKLYEKAKDFFGK